MGDGLEISGAGSSRVATEELYATAAQLNHLAAEAAAVSAQLALASSLVSMGELYRADLPLAARARDDVDQVRFALTEVDLEARGLAWALTSAADGYGFVEFVIARAFGGLRGAGAGLLGTVAPLAAPALVPAVGAAALAELQGGHVSEFLGTRAGADAVRSGVMLADDVVMGGLGIPRPIAQVLGDDGLGLMGLPFAAAMTMKAGSALGVFRETPVALAASTPVAGTAAPRTFSERLARVPDPETNGGYQVVIDKYEVPGEDARYQVFVAGTVTFDPVATDEPWDMTSNMSNAVGHDGGSYRAVAEAMAAAGITADSPVQLVGYSQGGGTIAQLAASGDYSVQGILSFGGPTGQVDLPDSVPTVLVEHSNDIVPALGGTQQNDHAVIVEREADPATDGTEGLIFPAHQRPAYEASAALMDATANPDLRATERQLDDFVPAGATVVTTAYRFERVSSAVSSSSVPGAAECR